MADRTWNRIDAKVWDEWKLSKCARCCLVMIISISPNQYGIFDPSPQGRVMDWFGGIFTHDELEDAFVELDRAGVTKCFRGGQCLWLVKKFKREIGGLRTKLHVKGVENMLEDFPEITDQFNHLYGIQIESRLPKSESESPKPQLGSNKLITDSDTEEHNIPPDASEQERLILAEFRNCPKHKTAFSYEKSLVYLRKISIDFPRLNILEVAKDLYAWLESNPTKYFSHSRLRNFCDSAQSRGNRQLEIVQPAIDRDQDPTLDADRWS